MVSIISRLTEVIVDSLDKLPVNIVLRNEAEDVEGVPEGDLHLFHHEKLDHYVHHYQQRHKQDENASQNVEV
jgi:hypothetical protein